MIKNILLFAGILAMVGFWTKTLHAQFGSVETDAIDKPVVIELFTSQSCSSCPPADRNLAELSKNPNVIALGFHVTYWNHLHWEDTLSHEFSTNRQRAYAAYKRNGRVYTPQMIVNGGEEFVGSRSGSIASAVKSARTIKPIKVSKTVGTVQIELPEIEKGEYKLWLAGVQREHHQDIPSGENRGKALTYANAVQTMLDGGAWDGSVKPLIYQITPDEKIDHYVILAQKNGHGPIIAAGKSP